MQQQLAVLREDNSTNECILEVLQFLQTHVLRSATSTQALGSGVLLSTLVGIAERHLKLSIVCTQIMECLLLLVSHCCEHEEQAFSEEKRYTLIKFIAAKNFVVLQASHLRGTQPGELLKQVLRSTKDMERMLHEGDNAKQLPHFFQYANDGRLAFFRIYFFALLGTICTERGYPPPKVLVDAVVQIRMASVKNVMRIVTQMQWGDKKDGDECGVAAVGEVSDLIPCFWYAFVSISEYAQDATEAKAQIAVHAQEALNRAQTHEGLSDIARDFYNLLQFLLRKREEHLEAGRQDADLMMQNLLLEEEKKRGTGKGESNAARKKKARAKGRPCEASPAPTAAAAARESGAGAETSAAAAPGAACASVSFASAGTERAHAPKIVGECVVCLAEVTSDKETALVPCGHKCLCLLCIQRKTETCPICKQAVTCSIPLFNGWNVIPGV